MVYWGPEIGGFLLFRAICFHSFKELTKAPLLTTGDPYIEESKIFITNN